MDPLTRQLVKLSISSNDNANLMMDLLLSKKNAAARKEWLEKKGSLAKI
jgi:topoisomerase-4 subunit B